MYGGRITSEERSAISTYVGVGIAIVLIAGGLYVFFLAQKEKRETTGFDPNRPVPSDAVLKRRLKAEEYFVVREGGTQTRSEEHTSELQSRFDLVCRLL